MDTNHVLVTEGPVFAISAPNGNLRRGTTDGFYAYDTRFLSTFRLTINGWEPRAVSARQLDHPLASFYASSRTGRGGQTRTLSIVRDRYVSEGLHEDIHVVSHSAQTQPVRLELAFDVDFADIFEVRLKPVFKPARVVLDSRYGQHLCMVYQQGDFHRETWISFSQEPNLSGKVATFDIVLRPKEIWKTCVTILPFLETASSCLPMKCTEAVMGSPFGAYQRRGKVLPLSELQPEDHPKLLWADLPRLETDYPELRQVYERALDDLRALRLEYIKGYPILAAGVPWFATVFGRDSIISAIQTKLLTSELMVGTLHTLASLQAQASDKFREAEPGKIPHEMRQGELSVLEQMPHSRYYGSVDATPLFLILLWEAYQWTGDIGLLRQFLPAAEAALRWIDRYGDMDGDGFVEYLRHTRQGLRNQGWKDSEDSISFADGKLARGPIALAEVQGYVYDAKRKMADIYHILGDSNRARRLERAAEKLKEQFNVAFWIEDLGYYAVALDGAKRQVNSVTSNPGHCLWSGIIDSEKAAMVIERLMSPDIFSGWGIRTLSTEMARYDPLSYHNGSIWPHDNSIISAGMIRYGFAKEAIEVALAILAAAPAFPYSQLPELFAGYPRREYSFPVPYPAANAPQAWASGAAIHLLETLLGVTAIGDRLLQEAPPDGISIALVGVPYRGSKRRLGATSH